MVPHVEVLTVSNGSNGIGSGGEETIVVTAPDGAAAEAIADARDRHTTHVGARRRAAARRTGHDPATLGSRRRWSPRDPGERRPVRPARPGPARLVRDVASWANTGVIQAEFVKCPSAEGSPTSSASVSALLIDATLPSLDRDLIDAARADGCAVLVVDDPRRARDWTAVGASATLAAPFDPEEGAAWTS